MSKIKITFQGAHGAYSDLAARAIFPNDETLPCATFEAAMQAVINGEAAHAVIPVDNSIAGRVADVHHLLPESGLKIIGEHYQPIRHCLLGLKDAELSNITDVYSHLHALPQCRNLIKDHGFIAHVGGDTAGSAKMISARGDKTLAAIASSLAAEIYDLKILQEDVQDAEHNTTRFLVLSATALTPNYDKNKRYLTTLVFQTRNIPAALYKALGGFATNGVNLTKLESYMLGGKFEATQFYCDAEGHLESKALKQAIEELTFFAKDVTVLGCYKAA